MPLWRVPPRPSGRLRRDVDGSAGGWFSVGPLRRSDSALRRRVSQPKTANTTLRVLEATAEALEVPLSALFDERT
jgi:hypothetical protein